MELPKQIGTYKVVRKAGAGGMGLVLEAHDPQLNRRVAIKFPHEAEGETGRLLRERFTREAKSLSAIRHPNLITLYEVGEHEGRPYAVLEWIEGKTLQHKVETEGPLDEGLAARMVAKLAMATHYLHLNGYLHRDIKPENVLLREGEPVLADMGLVKDTYEDPNAQALTIAGRALGTPDYAPPELIRGDLEATGPRSDVFGLGATLYFLLTGRAPRGNSPTIKQFLAQQIAPAKRYREDLDPVLSDLCRRSLALTPARRFRSAQSFADSLIRWAMIRDQGKAIYGKGFASLWEEEASFEGFADRPPDLESPRDTPWIYPVSILLAAAGVATFAASTYLVMDIDSTKPISSARQATEERQANTLEEAQGKIRRLKQIHTAELAEHRRWVKFYQDARTKQLGEVREQMRVAESVRLVRLRRELAAARKQSLREKRSLRLMHSKAAKPPAWWTALRADQRPASLLPAGVTWGSQPGRYEHPVDGSELVWLPPSRNPKVASVFVGVYEVTRAQYHHFCDETGHIAPAAEADSNLRHPVVNVSYKDAQAYCRWAGGRLLGDSEWFSAALGPRARDWPWGAGLAGFLQNTSGVPIDVGSCPEGASPCGAMDFAGNASEWVSSPKDPDKPGQLILGNSFLQDGLARLRSARRRKLSDYRSLDVGFRIAVSADE
ncbi:MAG: SUMF1/EgtB/PvdO family nonheme iron enzyme [Planctomycetes bacterium]|nr:SUMF1/EgtB/PvdO family nonheme iron enzyme [Planctomycetota bacterium]